jgi:hypothetical protein
MKNNGVCPKCNSSDIIRIPGEIGSIAGNNIQVGGGRVPVTRYLCGNCGYIEEWLDSEVNLQNIKKKFQHREEKGG